MKVNNATMWRLANRWKTGTTPQAKRKNYKLNHNNVQDLCTRTGNCVCSRIYTREEEWTNSEALLWAPELSQETINFCRWSHHHLTIIDFSAVTDDDIYIMMSVCLFVCNEKSSLFLEIFFWNFFFWKSFFFLIFFWFFFLIFFWNFFWKFFFWNFFLENFFF